MGNVIPSILTFVFWLIAAKVTNAEAIGLASSISSFVMIMATIDLINMSVGMKRDLGLAVSTNDITTFKKIIVNVTIYVCIAVGVSSIVIVIPDIHLLDSLGIKYQYVWIIILMIYALAFQQIFSEALTAALRSKDTFMPLLIGSLARILILLVITSLTNTPDIAVIIAYSSMLFISAGYCAIYLIKNFGFTLMDIRTYGVRFSIPSVFKASIVGWIPQIIKVLGSQLGIVTIFAFGGAVEAGKFYVPMSIFLVALFVVSGINRVSHPLISGMSTKEKQANFFLHSTKTAFIFTIPVTMPLLFFPNDFLRLIGDDFGSSAGSLVILMASLPLVILCEMLYFFVYGRGDNKAVLYLGLAGNIPRTILYFILVPLYGINGASLAYLIGSLSQLALTIRIANEHLINFQFKKYTILTVIPASIGLLVWMLNLHFLLSSLIIVFGSMLGYVKMDLLTDEELHGILHVVFPKRIAEKTYPALSRITQIIR
jgi:O-antigen/teichoic acid export membrane protein